LYSERSYRLGSRQRDARFFHARRQDRPARTICATQSQNAQPDHETGENSPNEPLSSSRWSHCFLRSFPPSLFSPVHSKPSLFFACALLNRSFRKISPFAYFAYFAVYFAVSSSSLFVQVDQQLHRRFNKLLP